MPTPHVADVAIDAFNSRTLSGSDLVAFADHLAGCEACRRRVAGRTNTGDAALRLEEGLGLVEHVSEDDVHAYVDGRLDATSRERVASHLRVCSSCAAEVNDLERFARQAPGHGSSRRPIYLTLAAAAGLVLAAAVWREAHPAPQELRVTLDDDGGAIGVASNGTLRVAGALTPAQQNSVSDALAHRRLAVPSAARDLAGPAATLMGPADADLFHVEAPVATMVLEDRPEFRWTVMPGAHGYVVTVQEQGAGIVATSPVLTANAWTPQAALAAGRTYVWQVAATTGGAEIVAPGPSLPPAKFGVIDSATASALRALPPSHAVRGILFANAGLLDAAERELAALAARNPDSPVARDLLQQVRNARHASHASPQR